MKVISDVDKEMLTDDVIDMLSKIGEVRFGPFSDDEFLREVDRTDAIFLESTVIDERVLRAAPRLRIVARYGVGYDNVDVEACTRRGVYVTITRGVLSEAVADLTLTFMLCLSRKLIGMNRYTREVWAERGEFLKLGSDLKQKVCGIIGLGQIGFEVAKRVHAFGMRILYHDVVRNERAEELLSSRLVELDELLRESDYVTVHVFLDERTRGMIGRRELSLMKESAYLINTARGAVIDQSVLTEFLKENRIAGAGLDVFEEEPIPSDDPLLKLSNVVLTPHVGASTRETKDAMALSAIRNISVALRGEVPPDLVPQQRGKVFRKSSV